MESLLELALSLLPLSLLSVGGAMAMLPELQRIVVESQGWMDAGRFAALYGLASAAPGPNVIVGTLIGAQVAGIPGAVVATLALCGPSSVLTYVAYQYRMRLRGHRWVRAIEDGLAPITVGLVLASGFLVARGANETPAAWGLAAVAAGVALLTRCNPLWLIGAGGMAGLMGFMQ